MQICDVKKICAGHTPYSKMAENTLFFCLHVNWPLLPRFKPNIPLNSVDGSKQQGPINNETKE